MANYNHGGYIVNAYSDETIGRGHGLMSAGTDNDRANEKNFQKSL
jgi:hypothetical protein